jgi:hypothetical protein
MENVLVCDLFFVIFSNESGRMICERSLSESLSCQDVWRSRMDCGTSGFVCNTLPGWPVIIVGSQFSLSLFLNSVLNIIFLFCYEWMKNNICQTCCVCFSFSTLVAERAPHLFSCHDTKPSNNRLYEVLIFHFKSISFVWFSLTIPDKWHRFVTLCDVGYRWNRLGEKYSISWLVLEVFGWMYICSF